MPKRTLEKRIDELRGLRQSPPGPETTETLRKALEDRSNVIVAQAAKIAGELRLDALAGDLIGAFERLIDDGASRDPQCRAKKAIVSALKTMDHSDSAVFVRGLRHVQMEAVWGGHEDMAAALRGSCALALVQCSDLRRADMLRLIVEAFTDNADSVRADAARALEQLEGDDAALLLRFKARVGDAKPRVVGQALESLLNVEGERALPFVSEFLESRDAELFEEAALVLGASRLPEALALLRTAWERDRNRPRGDALLRLIGASRRPEGIDFLISLIRDGSDRDASSAAKALQIHRDSREIQERVQEALKSRKR